MISCHKAGLTVPPLFCYGVAFHLFQFFACARDDKPAVLDAAKAKNLICQMTKFLASPLHNDHLQAVMMIKVHVRRCEDAATSVMLGLDQFFRQVRPVMVVHDRQSPHDDLVRVRFLTDQMVTDEVADGFRAVLVVSFGNGHIEFGKQFPVDGKACPR